MKRVLQVLGSLQRGGAETMVMNVYREIDRNKIQFDFLLKEKVSEGYEEEVRKMGGNIFYIESPKKIGIKKYIQQVIRVIKENGPYCAVHSHMNVMSGLIMIASFLAGVKTRISHSHSTMFNNNKIVELVGKSLICFFSNKKVACGFLAGKALFGFSSYNIIPNGIDTNKFLLDNIHEKTLLKRSLGMDCQKIQLCHIGRFVDVKNHKFILNLAKELKLKGVQYELHLLGNGELMDAIIEQAKEDGIDEIKFHGSVDNANEFLKACDIFILPSKYEGLPVTLVEAQSAGINCLISDSITKEVDFGLGLIRYLKLNEEDWIREIQKIGIKEKIINPNLIKEKISSVGYDIKDSSKMMINLYL